MRILHMIPDIGISNGVMSNLLNYFSAMPDDVKFDVLYFSEKEQTRQKDIEALGGRVYKIDPPSPKDLLTNKMDYFFSEHKNEWSALHINCPHFALFIAPSAKKAGIKKIFVHCHTTYFSLKGNGARNRLLSLYAKYFIKDKLACSRESGRIWYGNKKFSVINNAVDCKRYSFSEFVRKNVRAKLNLSDNFVVCHIGKTDIQVKNHPFLLEIFARIKAKKNNAKLLLIGAVETQELKALCNTLHISDDVVFYGFADNVNELLQGADVFVFPSISEGLPVSVVEAQAASLPVLMSDAITDEVVITDDIVAASLNDSADLWADKAIEIADKQRKDNFDLMKNAGWDIHSCAEKLLSLYEG